MYVWKLLSDFIIFKQQKTIHIVCILIHNALILMLCKMICTGIFHNPRAYLVKWYPLNS